MDTEESVANGDWEMNRDCTAAVANLHEGRDMTGVIHEGRRRLSAPIRGKTKKRCPYCPFTSYYATSITVHRRRHTGEKPYRCLHCNKSFGDRSNMNSHMKRYHGDERKRNTEKLSKLKIVPSQSSNNLTSDASPVKSVSELIADMPFISNIYSQSSSSLEQSRQNTCESVKPPLVQRNQAYSIMPKANRRKATVFKKQMQSQSAENHSFSSDSGNSGCEIPLNADSLHAFRSDEYDEEIKNNNLLRMAQVPLVSEEIHASSEPSTSSTELGNATLPSSKATETVELKLSDLYSCRHCGIYFKSCILHTLHMGSHGYDDPFKCNTCGVKCNDALEFHCHFMRAVHNGSL